MKMQGVPVVSRWAPQTQTRFATDTVATSRVPPQHAAIPLSNQLPLVQQLAQQPAQQQHQMPRFVTHPTISTAAVQPETKTVDYRDYSSLVAMLERGKPVMVLMQGPSGSGKSRWSRGALQHCLDHKLIRTGSIFSTDDYFETANGYVFRGDRIALAHEENQKRVHAAMRSSSPPDLIIIDNTNCKRKDAMFYVACSSHYNYSLLVHKPATPWASNEAELVKKSTHNVPDYCIRRYLAEYDRDFTAENLLDDYSKVSRVPQDRR